MVLQKSQICLPDPMTNQSFQQLVKLFVSRYFKLRKNVDRSYLAKYKNTKYLTICGMAKQFNQLETKFKFKTTKTTKYLYKLETSNANLPDKRLEPANFYKYQN